MKAKRKDQEESRKEGQEEGLSLSRARGWGLRIQFGGVDFKLQTNFRRWMLDDVAWNRNLSEA